jgi:PIN domain nuclease of toxin-antitoxin system
LIKSADQVFVSAASIWEVAIKAALGKIKVNAGELVASTEASGFVELPGRASHAAIVSKLPAHHSDPFDRLLIAQAIGEPLKLLTSDAILAKYSDNVVLVS